MSIISLLYRIGWTSPNMIFEILFCEYQDGFNSLSELLRSNDIKPMDFDLNVARLNRSYVYALQYFGKFIAKRVNLHQEAKVFW